MDEDRRILDDRVIEYDGLAVVMLAAAFVGVSVVAGWMVSASAQVFDLRVVVASAVMGAAVIGAWIVGYPHRAAIPAVAIVILCAMIVLPIMFRMDGALLREGVGTPPGRLYVAMGLYIGGIGVAFLAFLVFGFFGPLAGAILGLRRGEKRARETLALHAALTAAAMALVFLPRFWL